jgi:putative ABC transport system permease protein
MIPLNSIHLLRIVRASLDSLRVNKMRSALTMLGIIIGVAAVITTIAIGTGATQRIQEQIASVGSNLVLVMPGSLTTFGLRMGAGNAATLTEDDATAIATEIPSVAITAPTVRGGAQVVYGNNNWGTNIQGVTPAFLTIRDLHVAAGEAFTEEDVAASTKVALLGPTVAARLFNGADPVGQTIRIRNVPIRVVGVLGSKGQSPTGQDQDDTILLPLTTAKRKVLGARISNAASVGTILVQASGPSAVADAERQITELLRQRHHIQPGQDDDFSVRNLEELFAAQESSARVMSILLGAVASVSLIVGGIGIMNIMLVSVSERTREIGLRQAVGAKTRSILTQFLVEAAMLSLVGGCIGILLGVAASLAISRWADWNTVISPSALLLSFCFSAAIGVLFGYYPAHKAAYLNPIDALRYE